MIDFLLGVLLVVQVLGWAGIVVGAIFWLDKVTS